MLATRPSHFLAKFRPGLPTPVAAPRANEMKPPRTQNKRNKREGIQPATNADQQHGPPKPPRTQRDQHRTNDTSDPKIRENETTANAEQPKPKATRKAKQPPTPIPRPLQEALDSID